MKKWNAPVIAELDINQTENGYCTPFEEGVYGIAYRDCNTTVVAGVYWPYGPEPSQQSNEGGEKGRGESPSTSDLTDSISGPVVIG